MRCKKKAVSTTKIFFIEGGAKYYIETKKTDILQYIC